MLESSGAGGTYVMLESSGAGAGTRRFLQWLPRPVFSCVILKQNFMYHQDLPFHITVSFVICKKSIVSSRIFSLPSGKSVRFWSCRLGFDFKSSQTNDFKSIVHSLPA